MYYLFYLELSHSPQTNVCEKNYKYKAQSAPKRRYCPAHYAQILFLFPKRIDFPSDHCEGK